MEDGCLMVVPLVSQPMLGPGIVLGFTFMPSPHTTLTGKDKSLHLKTVAIGAPKGKLAYIIT